MYQLDLVTTRSAKTEKKKFSTILIQSDIWTQNQIVCLIFLIFFYYSKFLKIGRFSVYFKYLKDWKSEIFGSIHLKSEILMLHKTLKLQHNDVEVLPEHREIIMQSWPTTPIYCQFSLSLSFQDRLKRKKEIKMALFINILNLPLESWFILVIQYFFQKNPVTL